MAKQHLTAKRVELIWALSLQDYSYADICEIFNISHRSTVMRIIAHKPQGWQPRWVKRLEDVVLMHTVEVDDSVA